MSRDDRGVPIHFRLSRRVNFVFPVGVEPAVRYKMGDGETMNEALTE